MTKTQFKSTTLAVTLIIILFVPQKGLAWGGRGHDSICQAAIHLVKNQNLKDYLSNKPQIMGHLCNVPDTYWRSLPRDLTQHGDPTHYINPEALGLTVKDIPTDLKKLIYKYTGTQTDKEIKKETETALPQKKIVSVPLDMGTNWWRADQFYRSAIESGKKLKDSPAPTNKSEQQNEKLPYNKAAFEMLIAMGVMGHFVGDNSQPLHISSDYDGYAANSGGIHAYYEDACVAEFGPNLQALIVKKAQQLKSLKFITATTTVEKMKALGELSLSEAKDIFKLDPIISPSTLKLEKGMSLRTEAKRQPPSVGQKRFEKLIVVQMARSSLLLAKLWDEIYEKSGSPELKAYKSYAYPFKPDFVMPDYYDVTVEGQKKK